MEEYGSLLTAKSLKDLNQKLIEMEIPIQVAVRICPAERAANISAPQFQLKETGDAANGGYSTTIIPKDLKSDPEKELTESSNEYRQCVQAIPLNDLPDFAGRNEIIGLENGGMAAGVLQVGGNHSFPVTHALSEHVNQSQVYHQTVSHLMSLFMEGFDASVVTYGQFGTGKTYTLYGQFMDEKGKRYSKRGKKKTNCNSNDNVNVNEGELDQGDDDEMEEEEGIVQRCIREIFNQMSHHPERNYIINIGWVDICGDEITDILGVGNVTCTKLTDVFHWLEIGLNTMATNINRGYESGAGIMRISHTLFTLTLEQQWISKDGLIQHRLSTASFSDLCGKRVLYLNSRQEAINIPLDLEVLEQVVCTLAEPSLLYGGGNNIVPYLKTMLTRLLKDSFGGRAQTLMILCVSPLEKDIHETIRNLQFALKVQTVRNYVIMNTFSDDNTPITPTTTITDPIATPLIHTMTAAAAAATTTTTIAAAAPPQLPASNSAQIQDHFGLQFAASQWCKLVMNAEGLFAKLISSYNLSEMDREQIDEWLFLKQECEECLSSNELLRSTKQLRPIQEDDEPGDNISETEIILDIHDEKVRKEKDQEQEDIGEGDEEEEEEEETEEQQQKPEEGQLEVIDESENDSDSESQRPDLDEKVEHLMEELKLKTDSIVQEKYEEFMKNHPKGIMESEESSKLLHSIHLSLCQNELKNANNRRTSVSGGSGGVDGSGGRRRSLQPGTTLSSAEIAMLNRVAARDAKETTEHENNTKDLMNDEVNLENDDDHYHYHQHQQHSGVNRMTTNSPIDIIQRKLRKLEIEIGARLKQIKEVQTTIQLKKNIISELIKNSDTRSNAKQKFHKKRAKLEAEYDKVKKTLAKAVLQGRDREDIDRLKAMVAHLDQRLKDVTSIKHIAGESGAKLKKLQHSLQESKQLLEDLQRKVKKEEKLKEALEEELHGLKDGRKEKEKENSRSILMKFNENDEHDNNVSNSGSTEKGNHLKQMQARIAHLDHVLREKCENLEQQNVDEGQREELRHEIRNLRRTRDHLLDQRCLLDLKLKREKSLSQCEERKLLECDEAIEAIDAAIEFKNELICGHKSIDTSERLEREKGEQMLIARLNKLSLEEMRTMLYKYFNKVIDLRDSSKKLEIQLIQLERQRDAWEWKERVLSNAVHQARLEGERNIVLLQRQHELQKALILRHLVEETSNSTTSSNSYSDPLLPAITTANTYLQTVNTHALQHHHHQQQQQQQQQSQYHHQQSHHHHIHHHQQHHYTHQNAQHHHRHHMLMAGNGNNSPPSGTTSTATTSAATATALALNHSNDSDYGYLMDNNNIKLMKTPKLSELEMSPLLDGDQQNLAKYRLSLGRFKKSRETKNKLFKFQMLTRYANQNDEQELITKTAAITATTIPTTAVTTTAMACQSHRKDRRGPDKDLREREKTLAIIPQENLKKLATSTNSTKVTRQRNKIIIQDASRTN